MEITLIFILINVAIHILPFVVSFGNSPADSFGIFQQMFSKSNSAINDGEFYRLITANFLHGGIVHLGVNMLSLYQAGPIVNKLFGNWGFVLIFILSGIGGSLFSYFFNQFPSVGASGAIFGLIGSLLAFAILSNDYGLVSNLFFIIILNFGISLSPNSGIDNWGHLGGLVTGFLLAVGLIFGKGML